MRPTCQARKAQYLATKSVHLQTVVARCLLRLLREFEIVAQKCICVLATKTSMTVMNELAAHLTDKQADGLLRRPLRPGEKVKGIEELDAQEQAVLLCEKKVRSLANSVRINYCDLYGFLKFGFKEFAISLNRPRVIRALSLGRLAHYPKFNQFTVEQNIFLHFPPEKEPWSHGIVEAAIQDVKHVASANQKEALDNLPEVTLALATSALNSTEYTAGFSSHQWAFGAKYSINDEDARMWQGVAPHLDFINASKARLAAEEIARQSRARRVLSKLADTTVKQPLRQYKITDLVMVWRKVQVGDQHQGSRGGHKNSSRRQSDFIMNCMTSDEDPSSWKTLEDLLPHRSYDDVTSEVPGADELELPGLPEEPDETTYAPIRRAIGKSTLGPSDYKKVHRSTWIGLGPRSTTPAKYLPDPVPRPEPGGSSSSAKLSPPEGLEEYTPSSGGEDANSYENKKRSDDGAPVTEPETKKPRHEDYDLGWVEALQAEAMEEITHEDIFNVLQVYDGDCLSIEIEINVASHTQKRNFLHNPIAYLTKKLNSAEVHLKHLSDAERLLFVRAKAKEVSSFLKNQAVRKCLDDNELPVRLKSFARKKGGDAMAGLTEEMKQLAGFRRGVPLQNNHRGATLENSEYLASKENVQPVELENLKRTPKDQIELWIWEVDDDLDQMVGQHLLSLKDLDQDEQ
eukprot:g891.t1